MTLSYRISTKLYETDEQFARLVEFLTQHRPAVDEISLFTEYWHHGYFPLDRFARRAELLGRRIDQLHAEGFASVGINMLDTIGHVDEAWDFLPPWPFPAMVGHDGSVSRCSACPNSEEFREYIKEKYRLIAKARPDFIWVDDDIRMHNHAVGYGCFCSICLAKFDHDVTDREQLVAKLNAPDGGELRRAWVEHNANTLDGVLQDVAGAVREVGPAIGVGLMTAGPGWTTYSGQALSRWMRTLGGRRARPGGGFYDDDLPRDMVRYKVFETARQCIALPASVDNVQYELENFPYQKLGKSVRTVLNECTLAFAAGCNGIAFNALKDLPGSLMDYHDLLDAIERERRLWQALDAAQTGLPMVGLWSAYDDRLAAKREVRNGDWFTPASAGKDYYINQTTMLAEIGLPLAVDRTSACAILLAGRIAEAFSDDELRLMLAGGVLMDATALQVLWDRGLGEFAGVKPGTCYDNGVLECFTSHPLNGAFAGDARDARLSFWPAPAQTLLPLDGEVGDVAHLIGYDGSDLGMCAAVYANDQGGRVVTMGYAPWTKLGSSAKRSQMIALADWASGDRLPVLIDRTVRVTPFVRMSHDGRRFAAVLLNTGYDPTGLLEVRLRARPDEIVLLTSAGERPVPGRRNSGETIITLPGIPAWHSAVLVGR